MSRHTIATVIAFACIPQFASAQSVSTIVNNGPSSNRLDIVVLGDGYTTADLARYTTDVQQFLLTLFHQQPFSEYRSYFNVHRIDLFSAESGVDHPETNTFKTTALDGTYNCAGIQRLICVDTAKVFSVVSAVTLPSQRDIIVILVNDPVYGGSGGAVAVSSKHADALEIILHELGHSFGLLADEYGGPPPPDCNSSLEPFEVNATMATSRAAIKWNHWIDASTPVPTLSTGAGVPGVYVGAKYCDTGLYRPTYNSKMRSLGAPFEQINTEQLVRRVYNWASPIESSSPAASTVAVVKGQIVSFSIQTLLPETHTLDRRWLLDGSATGAGVSYVLDSGSLSVGDHTVVAVVRDSTTMVRSDPDGSLTEMVTWTLRVTTAGARVPTSRQECANNGWQNLSRADGSTFKSQGDCIQYVTTGK